jgi:3-dehydroquinate synthase
MLHTFHHGDYPIFLGDLRESFPAWLHDRGCSQIYLLTDENTRCHCLPIFLEKTGLPNEVTITEIPAGENFKNLSTCERIWQQMLDAKLDRKALVLNLGGGVIGDMGGFCAATWKRGVDFVQVPTTLLAMTDAAIGGKLGIDFQGVKNTIGVFKNPAAVFVDPDFLKTLPERELRSGFAEVIKHALIGDPELWQMVQSEAVTQSHRLTTSAWLDLLRASIAVKVRIVQEDPLEKGIRALLNFGHTIGHAVESYFLETNEPLTHGEAVAVGMICESLIAASTPPPTPPPNERGDVEDAATTSVHSTSPLPFGGGVGGGVETLIAVISRIFPHRPVPESSFPEIWNLMQQDKKNISGKVRMAVPGATPFSMRILEPGREEVERSLLFYNSLNG